MNDNYFDIVMLFERLHRLFLDVITSELDRASLSDISGVQAVILYNIGHDKLTVGEISNRGYYLGSNVSYNLRKMLENDYVVQESSETDKRSVFVSLSPKGKKVLATLEKAMKRHLSSLPFNGLKEKDLATLQQLARKLEQFWSHLHIHDRRG